MATFSRGEIDYRRSPSSAPQPTSAPSLSLLHPHPAGFVVAESEEGIIWRVRMTSNPSLPPPHSRRKNEPATTGSDTTPAPARTVEELRRLVISILDSQWHVPLDAERRCRGHQVRTTQRASRLAVSKSHRSDRHYCLRHCHCRRHSLVLVLRWVRQPEASSVAMAPFSSPAAVSSSISSPVVLVSIMPRAEPVALSHHPMTSKPARTNESPLRRWDLVCDVVAQILLLPMVCVSVCGAVGLLLSLECMEKLQSRRLPFQRAPQQQQRRTSHECTSTRDCIAGANANRDQREKEEGRQDDAGTRRPLKKQRSSATSGTSSSTSTSSDLFATSSNSSSPLETRPLVHKASVKRKILRRRRVFIWDLDETLVLFASLYTGAFAQTHGKEIAAGVQLGEQMMTFMLAMLERHFFFNDLHDADIDHIHCLRNGAAGASEANANGPGPSPLVGVAAHYERIRKIYEREGAVDFLSDERSEWFAIREALVAAIDVFSTGWLQEARQVLELLTFSTSKSRASTATTAAPSNTVPVYDGEAAVEYENINLMVTNTQLAPALCKCLIYQLDAFFPIESVYSSSKLHKQHCFEQILRTYSSNNSDEVDTSVEFIAIGDGAEEEHVSRALGIQFHKIRSLADLKRLRFDLQLEARCPVGSM